MSAPLRTASAALALGLGWAGLVTTDAAAIQPQPAASTSEASPTPDLLPALSGYNDLWRPRGNNDLHGTVLQASPLAHNDRLTSWINQNATAAQRQRALHDAAYMAADGTGYDQSRTIQDGLGKTLGAIYLQGRIQGELPLTSALINSSDGSAGAYVSTDAAKKAFSYPRPYLPVSANATAAPGDEAECAPTVVNGSSLARNRANKPWADKAGNLRITRVAPITDTSKTYTTTDVVLDPDYGHTGICQGGAFPSGHTTTAYQAGITLATLLPEVAPNILARASEAGNNRIVLGVHYPLDIIGGRINGQVSLANRWSDPTYRAKVLQPARAELVGYLTKHCTRKLGVKTLAQCVAKDTAYTNSPYKGGVVPGGSAQKVRDRASAVRVYTERMSYGFKPTSSTKARPSVPAGAENLLLTAFPKLNDAQRRSLLAQTQIASGHPLDTTAAHAKNSAIPGSWQRLNLAAAMSATVKVVNDRQVRVISTGGKPAVR